MSNRERDLGRMESDRDAAETARAQSIFEKIYADNEWGRGSGVGSRQVNNLEYIAFVQKFMLLNRVETVVDFGCGDWQFSQFINWEVRRYLGVDVSDTVIRENQKRFGRGVVGFELFAGLEHLPSADLLLCKDVLQHLPSGLVQIYLKSFREKFRMMLITNDDFPYHRLNQDIAMGDWRTLRLDLDPFCERAAVVLSWVVLAEGGALTVRKLTYLLFGDGPW